MNARTLPAHDAATWGPALDEAVDVVANGGLVVLPTDTVYGIGADAFSPPAVQALLEAKGRGRQMPPPVLIADVRTLDGLATEVPAHARLLAEAFWPGGLTLIVRAQPSLAWDLGETHGTVALRVPDHATARALLRRTGPLAVSSANRTGFAAAVDAGEAYRQLGDRVRVYLDAGDAPGQVASTIVDATGPRLRVVRLGALDLETLNAVAPVLGLDGELPSDEPAAAAPDEEAPDEQTSDPQPPDDEAPAADAPGAGPDMVKDAPAGGAPG
ncbi:L-threonylcarbamoyladenylate synthase [Cellulomonas sp.]|uniref:L-threonylcarbamoyladenylate synthase n=1 Tax=Cellulomonas sp. TaxID=40001 RepID=UPI002585FEF5|nr:L-threonylcarbamoyladenylate synthase [Cellulomonas sp.]MCR6689278.1 L-threonylcarbamoyladenylate synthase [Cellulomonas sp.]